MVDGITLNIEGLKELQARMHKLGPEIEKKAMRSALLAGARIVKQEAQRTEPELTGRLKRATIIKRINNAYIVGVRHGRKEQKKDRDAYYWTFQEFDHLTRPKHGKRTHVERAFARNSGMKIIPGKHFLENALKNKYVEALSRIKEKLSQNIAKVVKTL